MEHTDPVKESVFVTYGSSSVSMEILAPGKTSFTDSFPLCNEIIFVFNGVYTNCPLFFEDKPG